MGKIFKNKNKQFMESAIINEQTYIDYLERFKRVATSMFQWVNLPSSMNARYLEETLYYYGQAGLLKDENYGFINTRVSSNGDINIYGLPTSLNCYSYSYSKSRKLYTGLPDNNKQKDCCVLVMNNQGRIPTSTTMELFAYRLYEAEQTAMVNIKSQKTPVMVLVDENQRLMMENLYSQYDGNRPFIFGDKNQLQNGILKAINTEAPFIADKVMDYKKEIWNEALTYLGINNISVEKKERLVTAEASQNNELVNLNLQSMLTPRKQACKEFNELFGLKGDKAIDVRLRSDLFNIIKSNESIITDYNNNGIDDEMEDITNE